MKICRAPVVSFLLLALVAARAQGQVEINAMDQDTNIWMEEVTGEKPLEWVRQQNAVSTKELENTPGFASLQEKFLGILNSKERIPAVVKHGKLFYNFWRDAKHVRGIWRRTTWAEY